MKGPSLKHMAQDYDPDLTLFDGRQSPTAAAVQRGVCRHLLNMGFHPLTEMTLATGRRVDIAAINAKGDILVIEIKSSLADFRADAKWEEYLDFCDAFYFAVPLDFPQDVLPQDAGLMVADKFGAEILREAAWERLPAPRRKSVTLQFALTAARRIRSIHDPDMPLGDL